MDGFLNFMGFIMAVAFSIFLILFVLWIIEWTRARTGARHPCGGYNPPSYSVTNSIRRLRRRIGEWEDGRRQRRYIPPQPAGCVPQPVYRGPHQTGPPPPGYQVPTQPPVQYQMPAPTPVTGGNPLRGTRTRIVSPPQYGNQGAMVAPTGIGSQAVTVVRARMPAGLESYGHRVDSYLDVPEHLECPLCLRDPRRTFNEGIMQIDRDRNQGINGNITGKYMHYKCAQIYFGANT